VGYEFGFRTQVNVVETMPADWERRHFDLTAFVARVNSLKLDEPALQGEGRLEAPWGLEGDVLLLERHAPPAGEPAWILVNKDRDRTFTVTLPEPARGRRLFRVCRDDAPGPERAPERLELRGAEVAYVLPG
jgi:starch synthase (maltosyl-transferring)